MDYVHYSRLKSLLKGWRTSCHVTHIPRDIGNIVNNCLLKKNYIDEVIQSNQNFNIECYKDNHRTNFYIKYKDSFFEGFLIKNEWDSYKMSCKN